MRLAELIIHLKNEQKFLEVSTCGMWPANLCSVYLSNFMRVRWVMALIGDAKQAWNKWSSWNWNKWTSRCNNLHMTYLLISAVVDCGSLTDPANGSVNHTAGTTFGQTATYSCNTGYNLVGDSIRTCQATGNWSGTAPTCRGMLLHSVCL